ncbi:MAG: hypothetical protein MK078_09705 [Crocinitomicaceae bacterium]|nr:hypothetical protein [Crocinitomicaceae bacterium]
MTTLLSILFSITMLHAGHHTITYIDGSNNSYSLDHSKLSYDPVTKEESSSGEYSGGEAKTVSLIDEEEIQLMHLFDKVLEDTENHIEKRTMGCGTIVEKNHDKKTTTYIAMKAESKQKLESYLKELIAK